VGTELSSREAVDNYDRNQGTDPVRDRALLLCRLLDRLDVSPETRFVGLSCGTGSLAVEAA